jgi:hypothetical protein
MNQVRVLNAIIAIAILIGMIVASVMGDGDLFIVVMGGLFVINGTVVIVRYLTTGRMIESLRFYERLRGRKSALIMGGIAFSLLTIYYFVFLVNYLFGF